MVKRKIIAILLATLFSIGIIAVFIFNEDREIANLVTTVGGVGLLVAPAILLYGLPVTFISEHVC